jgi:predicted dehydrogenase
VMEKVRIGVIGLGTMGRHYVKIYSQHPLAQVVGVCAPRQEQVDEIASTFKAEGYTRYEKMLERRDLDAVVVATPDALHFAPARDALETGRHVFIEKPFTTNLEEADQLIRLARSKKKKIQVAFNHRWLSSYYHGKIAVQSGQIGVPLMGYARKNDTIHVSTKHIKWAGQTTSAWFLSSHDIDLMRWWLASEAVEARALGRKELLASRGIPTYDVIQAQVKFASGAFATFESGWVYPDTFPSTVDSFMELIGTAGHLHFDRKRESIEISTEKKFSYPKMFLNSEVFGRMRGAFPSCLEDFLYAILDDTPTQVDGFDGRQVTAILVAIHQSLETGEAVKIAPPPADLARTSAAG